MVDAPGRNNRGLVAGDGIDGDSSATPALPREFDSRPHLFRLSSNLGKAIGKRLCGRIVGTSVAPEYVHSTTPS